MKKLIVLILMLALPAQKALAMDKPMARRVFTSLGLRVAEGRVIERRSLVNGDPMPRPYVVKPIDQGSSVGVYMEHMSLHDTFSNFRIVGARFGFNGEWNYGTPGLAAAHDTGRASSMDGAKKTASLR